jgi:hypothetical protein
MLGINFSLGEMQISLGSGTNGIARFGRVIGMGATGSARQALSNNG